MQPEIHARHRCGKACLIDRLGSGRATASYLTLQQNIGPTRANGAADACPGSAASHVQMELCLVCGSAEACYIRFDIMS
jgi:hypothetical protein